MLCGARSARALLFGISSVALLASGVLTPAQSQDAPQSVSTINLDTITVLPSKTPENVWDSLSATSAVRQDQLEKQMPTRPSDALLGMPGISFQERQDDPGSAITIRGLQNFGRVAVTIDGARQNFQRTGHAADGTFYLEPELLSGVDVVRGPVANIYGSGAIGGVVSFATKDVDDVLRAGQNFGVVTRGELGSNTGQGIGSSFAAARSQNVDVMVGGTYRSKSDYKDGHGNTVENSGYDVSTGIAKLTVRPADGHTLKFGYIHYDSSFKTGQPGSSIYDTGVQNDIANARWLYSRPDDRLFDFDGNIYWTKTSTDQTLLVNGGLIGAVGDKRNFTINTYGGDLHNTSRFDFAGFRNAITVGVDGFQDQVDTKGFATTFTPSGERTVSGGFAQWKANYSTWLEVIGALRYDRYELNGGGFNVTGDRLSPKITVGVTPIAGITPYVTYAEGYRAPAVTETLVAGIHPVPGVDFEFIPNPGLKPETGKTSEAGINFKFDNVLSRGDAFRAKLNVFRNNVDNYIDQVFINTGDVGQGGVVCTNVAFGGAPFAPDCVQYQKIAKARLEGFEFETAYDAGRWFAGLAGSHVKGKNLDADEPLATVPPDSITTTLGTRFFEQRMTIAMKWQAVEAKKASDIPNSAAGGPAFQPTGAYDLVNLYASYQFNPDVLATFTIENLLDEQYTTYSSIAPNAGISVKGALKVRFGEDFFKSKKG
jgi:hemoglobin/transferrin/lactoferrin receptor protein